MKRKITILFMDQNRYFTEGLRQGLSHYFNDQNIHTVFTENTAYKNTADVIFFAVESRNNMQHNYSLKLIHPSRQCLLLITERDQILPQNSPLLKACRRIISRESNIDNVIRQVERSLALQEIPGETDADKHTALSCREFDIMLHLSFGSSNSAIGRHLNISEKTVSNHKRSAMRKLNLHRDFELNYWLLHGGLYSVNRGQQR